MAACSVELSRQGARPTVIGYTVDIGQTSGEGIVVSDKALVKSLIKQLSHRVGELEREVAELKNRQANGPERDWRRTVGMFADNEIMKQIDAAGAAIREADRRRAKQSRSRSSGTKR